MLRQGRGADRVGELWNGRQHPKLEELRHFSLQNMSGKEYFEGIALQPSLTRKRKARSSQNVVMIWGSYFLVRSSTCKFWQSWLEKCTKNVTQFILDSSHEQLTFLDHEA